MNTRENIPRRAGVGLRLVLTALLAVAVLSGMTVAFVLAMSTSGGQAVTDNAPQAAGASQAQAPAVRPRTGHSDYLVGLTRNALQEGFGKDGVLLLAPGRGPGRAVVARRLRSLASTRNSRFGGRLTAGGLKPARPDDRHLTFIGPNSYVKVSADGTKFIFRGNIDDPLEIERARAAGRMIEKDELEKLGRRFIKDALGDFVKFGAEESLTFLGVKYLRDGDFSENGRGEEEVVANIAIFGREVRGVPVIGSGSKVAVWFANDRQPVGFDVDWPVYNALRTRQRVLPRERLNERVRATTVPPTGSARASVARFECGYVDLGATRRGVQIQAGCAIHYAGRHDDGTVWARVEYVPAAEKVVADPKWPLASLIARGRVINTDTPEFARYASKNPPPGLDTSPAREPQPDGARTRARRGPFRRGRL